VTARTLPAILLRSHPYGDTSQILRFLTPDLGVVAVVARGVRTKRSQGRGGGLELFVPGTLELDHRAGKSLHGFRSFEAAPDASVQGLAREMLALAGASYLAELVLAHAVEEEPQPELFPHLVTTFNALATEPTDLLPSILLGSGWWILGSFGFPPALDQCVACGAAPTLSPDDLVRFDLMAGGLRCTACAESGTGPRLGPGALEALRRVVHGEPTGALRGSLGLFRLLDRFARLHLGLERTFRSAPTVEDRIRFLMPDEPETEGLS
jgi:DNA repair protein RecO (recombination protein O)